jgi:1-acyl-sn-glycerol-3-phosphate acyltransferase
LASHALIVSNHVSWLDIFLINSAQPSRFIAKESIRSWPLIGFLSTKSGTVYLNRNSARDLRNTFKTLVTNLSQGEHFVFFPEGTASESQSKLLPFYSNFFEAAINAGAVIQPCVLHYVDENNQFHFAIESPVKLSIVQNIMRVLRSDTIHATLVILPPIPASGMQRRELSQNAYDAINEVIIRHPAYTNTGSLPETPGDLPDTPQ